MSTDPTAGARQRRAGARSRARRAQPSEEELRAAYEAELSRITSADMMLQAAVSLLNIGSFRLAPPRRGRARRGAAERERATSSRCATRSTACGRCWRSSSGASPASCARCATRSRSCRWPTRARPRPVAPAAQRRRPRRRHAPASRASRPPHGRRRRWTAGSRPSRPGRAGPGGRGRPSPAAGCGCRGAERPARAVFPRRRHDRLRARLHPVNVALSEPGRQMCARRSSRGTPIRPRRISVEQLSDEPWGRRRPCLRRLRCGLRPRDDALPARALARQREDAEHLAGRPAGRARLPEPPVHDDRGRRRRAVRRADLHPEHRGRLRVRDRRPAVGLDRLHRHERVGALERARRRGRARAASRRR